MFFSFLFFLHFRKIWRVNCTLTKTLADLFEKAVEPGHCRTLYKGSGDAQSAVRSLDKAAQSHCSRWMCTFVKGTFSVAGPANSLLLSVGHHPAFTSIYAAAPELPFHFSLFLHFYVVTCRMLLLAWSRAEPAGYINNSWGWGFRRCHTSHGSGSPSVRSGKETNAAL